MKNCNVIYREATKDDDLTSIAKYVHLTDNYIYPAICQDPTDKDWVEVISNCYISSDNLYYYKNFIVAELDGKIVGILCAINCGVKKRFIEDVSKFSPLYERISKVNEGYFLPLIKESENYSGYNITNVCVDENERGAGIGEKLIRYFLNIHKDLNIHLDVIASNKTAINLYSKMGFKITENYNGFSGDDNLLPCYHMQTFFNK